MKQIGDEFWGDWVSHPTSTDPIETRMLYRVIGIAKICEFGNYGKLIDVEKVEPIKVEKRIHNSDKLH